jgi:hypothetical protein
MLNYCGYVSGREKKVNDWLICYSGQSTVLGSEFQMKIDKKRKRNDPKFNCICIPREGLSSISKYPSSWMFILIGSLMSLSVFVNICCKFSFI